MVPLHAAVSHCTSSRLLPCNCACCLAAETGLALYITEFSLFSTWEGPNGRPISYLDEDTQADTTVALFKLWYGHPAVRGIFMWGWWDANMWVQDAGIYRWVATAGHCSWPSMVVQPRPVANAAAVPVCLLLCWQGSVAS
jgi:GH35 family endo-1,4-beta-xylanase